MALWNLIAVVPPPEQASESAGGLLLLAPLFALVGLVVVLACCKRGSGNTIDRCGLCGRVLPIRPGSHYCPACGGKWRRSPALHNSAPPD